MVNQISIKQISTRLYFHIIGIITLFLIICLNYSRQINLWGDEAISLNTAESSIENILIVDSVHTPFYYLLLKLIMTLGINGEQLLRAIHVVPFIIGLLIGYRILVSIFSETKNALITLSIVILLPNYIFYATNLRMYSLLFMFSMAFIAIVARVLNSKNDLNYWQLTALGLTSLGLLLSDYSGIIYYFPGLIYLLVQSFYTRRLYKSLFIVGGAGLLFLAIMLFFSNIGKNLQSILNWPVATSQNTGNINEGFIEFAKQMYLSLRPGLDLVYGAGIHPVLAIGLAIILLIIYIYSFLVMLKKSKNKLSILWILLISIIWLLAAPTGYGFTRLFLPSHFFMIAIMIYSIDFLNKASRVIYWIILGVLIAICLKEVIKPTLRLYNLIPYQQIAKDTLEVARKQEAKMILLSGNSLNAISIERYMKQQIRTPEKEEIKIVILENNDPKQVAEYKTYPLIFISHMQENEEFMDIKPFAMRLNKEFQEIKGYVDLQDLPYNLLWKKRITDRANQRYAIQTYLLE